MQVILRLPHGLASIAEASEVLGRDCRSTCSSCGLWTASDRPPREVEQDILRLEVVGHICAGELYVTVDLLVEFDLRLIDCGVGGIQCDGLIPYDLSRV